MKTRQQTKQPVMCKCWKWYRNNPTKSCLDNPYTQCAECLECSKYSDYVSAKMAGELD